MCLIVYYRSYSHPDFQSLYFTNPDFSEFINLKIFLYEGNDYGISKEEG